MCGVDNEFGMSADQLQYAIQFHILRLDSNLLIIKYYTQFSFRFLGKNGIANRH